MESTKNISPGLHMCAGCGLELVIRVIYDVLQDNFIEFGGPGCCLLTERCTVPCYGTLFTNMAPSASGVSRSLLHQGKDTTCLCIGGDGMFSDIAFGNLSAAAERGEHLMVVCYDNEAYMNTGIQRSSRTPEGSWTNTTPVGPAGHGKQKTQKPVSLLIAEHNVAYSATCSPAYMKDMRDKIARAREASREGFAFLHILAPCPTGWKSKPEMMIEHCRKAVQTNYFPLWEARYGQFHITQKIPSPQPVTEFTKTQRRFSHLDSAELSRLQEAIDSNFEHLSKLCGE